MKTDGLLKHLAATFLIALLIYGVAYFGIEHRRTRRGPWEVTFTQNAAGAPMLVVNQPSLAITNVQVVFPDATSPATNRTWRVDRPSPVPFATPFGRCVFMDTTFLPGTLVLDLFGHEVQLIPRVLTIDKQEQPWRSNAIISLPGTNPLQSAPAGTNSNQPSGRL